MAMIYVCVIYYRLWCHVIANCPQRMSVKNFENRSLIGEDMDKSKVARFLWPTLYYVLQVTVVVGAIPVTLLKPFVSHVTARCFSVASDCLVGVANTLAKYGFVCCFFSSKSCMLLSLIQWEELFHFCNLLFLSPEHCWRR